MGLRARAALAALFFGVATVGFAYLANKGPSIDRILVSEGGTYTNDPEDPGGPTRWGITLTDTRLYVKKNATAATVKALTRDQAVGIYDKKYWDALDGDELPSGLDYTMVDYGVNSGIARAGRVLRQILGLPTTDWHVTPEVLSAAKKRATTALIRAENAERLAFLKRLPTWPRFGGGWGKRVASVNAISLQLAAGAAVPLPASVDIVQKSNEGGRAAPSWWQSDNPFFRWTPLAPQPGPGKAS